MGKLLKGNFKQPCDFVGWFWWFCCGFGCLFLFFANGKVSVFSQSPEEPEEIAPQDHFKPFFFLYRKDHHRLSVFYKQTLKQKEKHGRLISEINNQPTKNTTNRH